jgi:hypothetical protein
MVVRNFEDFVRAELIRKIGVGEFTLPLFFENPISVGEDIKENFSAQRLLIDKFFNIVVDIARKSLTSSNDTIKNILFSESFAGMNADFHSKLPDCCWFNPIMYRTDQSLSGKIYEIQSPGSGWGDIPLLATVFQQLGKDVPDFALHFAENYAKNIIIATKKDSPKVFHMLDASSVPMGMRYLFAQTRPSIKYWGLDKDVNMADIDYVTAHSAASLITCNYYNKYLSSAIKGKTVFGIPPNLIFDQKVIYLLPFYRDTAYFFSEEIRDMFPFTSFIENGGFYDINGQFITIDEFSDKPKKDRGYFLKYGGADLSRNWGSRSVYRLSGSDCRKLLSEASKLSKKREIWLIQEDVSRNEISNISTDIRDIMNDNFHIKLSAFHGITGMLSIKVMARKHFKVHGQNDTYIGIAI